MGPQHRSMTARLHLLRRSQGRWACCFAMSALHDPNASATGWAIHGFISAVHYLTSWSLWTGRLG